MVLTSGGCAAPGWRVDESSGTDGGETLCAGAICMSAANFEMSSSSREGCAGRRAVAAIGAIGKAGGLVGDAPLSSALPRAATAGCC